MRIGRGRGGLREAQHRGQSLSWEQGLCIVYRGYCVGKEPGIEAFPNGNLGGEKVCWVEKSCWLATALFSPSTTEETFPSKRGYLGGGKVPGAGEERLPAGSQPAAGGGVPWW